MRLRERKKHGSAMIYLYPWHRNHEGVLMCLACPSADAELRIGRKAAAGSIAVAAPTDAPLALYSILLLSMIQL